MEIGLNQSWSSHVGGGQRVGDGSEAFTSLAL